MKLFGTEWLSTKNTKNVESHGGMALLREAMGVQNKYNDRKIWRPELTEKVPTPCNKTHIKTSTQEKKQWVMFICDSFLFKI